MDVEFFVYGVPLGNSYWGKEEDSAYFETMYNNTNENKMLIEIRKSNNGNIYCYYNYLVYKDVIGVEARPGSFIGISLRIDAYCLNMRDMYRVLDITYHAYIKNTFFKKEGNKIRFTINNFKDPTISAKIEEINKSILTLFQRIFVPDNFVLLNSTFLSRNNQSYFINLYDYHEIAIFDLIKKVGKINISPDYPTIAIKQVREEYEKNMQDSIRQYETAQKSDNEKMARLNLSIHTAKQTEESLRVEINQREERIRKLEQKLKEFGQRKNIEQLIGQVKEPIIQLADYFHQKNRSSLCEEEQEFEGSNRGRWLLKCVILLLLILFAFVVGMKFQESSSIKTKLDNTEKVSSKFSNRDKILTDSIMP